MPTPELPIEILQQAVDARAQHKTTLAAAESLGWTRGKLEHRLREAVRRNVRADQFSVEAFSSGDPSPTPPATRSDLAALRDKIFELETAAKARKDNKLDDEYVRRKILGLVKDASKASIPTWVVDLARGKSLPGVPVAMWSDWHFGEVVDPNQINGMNEFNLEIAERRIRRLVTSTVNLLRNHVVNPQYPGIVINLGGDMMSGDIHEELSESNDKEMMPCLLDLFSILVWAIGVMADEFGKVFVPCVTGNHGRNTRKPRAKGRNFTNFDWLLYQFLARHFEGDKRIQFFIPDGPDALYQVAGHRILLTHGDQFRGGDGMIGAAGPIIRGNKKKLARNSAIDLDFDTMIIGHWHQRMALPGLIVNSSLKGYDEYANTFNFAYEPPSQELFLVHPEYGIRNYIPVYLEEHVRARPAAEGWVSAFTK